MSENEVINNDEINERLQAMASQINTDHAESVQQMTLDTLRQRVAQREAVRIEAGEKVKLPEDRGCTVEEALANPPKAGPMRVEKLLGEEQNVGLGALYKVGKSTAGVDLGRCLVDGEPFLGKLAVSPLDGNFGYWNIEMSGKDMYSLVKAARIKKGDRFRYWNLKGYSIPILSDAGFEAVVNWLNDFEIEALAIDSHARLLRWCGVKENDNDGVKEVLTRLDEIKVATSVKNIVLLAHLGRKEHVPGHEHTRGAVSFDDWVDSRWIMTRTGNDRFTYAEGRGGVGLEETAVLLEDGQLVAGEGTREDAKIAKLVEELVGIVKKEPGLKTGEAQAKLSHGERADHLAATREAYGLDLIHSKPGKGTAKHLYAGPDPVGEPAREPIGGAPRNW